MVRVKICGITNAADALAAIDAGADLLGFNFYARSPRHIDEVEGAKIRRQLPKKIEAVGIFVNAPAADIANVCKSLKLDAAQLHGDESPETVAEVARSFTVWKAFRVEPDFHLKMLDEYPEASAFLFDAAHTGQYGGTGRTTDWDVARRAALSHRIILAGGLNVENVAAAVRIVRPYAVDVASGVGTKAGKEEHGRMPGFNQEVRRGGAHKINNAIGQGLLAVKMGKPRIIAETGAGQHGVASATVAAHLGLECVVYMGTEDMARQALNVARMRMVGAQVVGVESGSRTLKDAINEAMRDWVTNVRSTHYLLGSVLGAHPYPTMVRDFQAVIGGEARQQILGAEKRLPTHLFACVGGGSNSIGLFYNFLRDADVKMIGIEPRGPGTRTREPAARLAPPQGFSGCRPGVLP